MRYLGEDRPISGTQSEQMRNPVPARPGETNLTRHFRVACAATSAVAIAGLFVTATLAVASPASTLRLNTKATAANSSTDAQTNAQAVRKVLRQSTKVAGAAPSASPSPSIGSDVASRLAGLKLVNYYPAYHGWSRMWFEWDPAAIQADFTRMSAMGANGVRLILPVDVIGYPVPASTMVARLADAISMAAGSGLRVQITLFANWSSYSDLTTSESWAKSILSPYKADPRIVFVEIMNEINPRDATAMEWARNMLPFVRSVSGLPVAVSGQVGDMNTFAALVQALDTARPDIFSYHFYSSDPTIANGSFYWAKRIAAPTPVFVGETGMSTGLSGTDPSDPSMEHDQDVFFRAVEAASRYVGLPAPAPWIWQDFAPGTLCTCAPGTEYHFGLLRLDGSEKPAFVTLRDFFKFGIVRQ